MKLRDALKNIPTSDVRETLQSILKALKFLLDKNPLVQSHENEWEHMVFRRSAGTTDEMLGDILSSVLTAASVISHPMFCQADHVHIAEAARDIFALVFEIGDALEREKDTAEHNSKLLNKLEFQSYELMGTIFFNWVLRGNNFSSALKLRDDFISSPIKSAPELCAICLEENVTEENGYTVLPRCKHNFCLPCFEIWFKQKETCPVCRASAVNFLTSKKLRQCQDYATQLGASGHTQPESFSLRSPSRGLSLRNQPEKASGTSTLSGLLYTWIFLGITVLQTNLRCF